MSTRCQVKVDGSKSINGESVTLYHHTDGYPTYMLPLLAKAYKTAKDNGATWELGRGGKVASFIAASDPGVFEPEAGHELHGDIEWYYVIHPRSKESDDEKAKEWTVDVYKTPFDIGSVKNLKPIVKEMPISEAANIAGAIETEKIEERKTKDKIVKGKEVKKDITSFYKRKGYTSKHSQNIAGAVAGEEHKKRLRA